MTTTLPLEELLQRPAAVKKLTAAGKRVEITDRGRPLWTLVPAKNQRGRKETGAEWMDTELEAMLAEKETTVSGAEILLRSRE